MGSNNTAVLAESLNLEFQTSWEIKIEEVVWFVINRFMLQFFTFKEKVLNMSVSFFFPLDVHLSLTACSAMRGGLGRNERGR